MTQISWYVPASFDSSDDAVEVGPRGQQTYGLVEHHTRHVHTALSLFEVLA